MMHKNLKEIIPNDHENFEVCSKCNGRCCKHQPCIVFPEDFESITKETIIAKINDGYCLDYWEGNDLAKNKTPWFIRPRIKIFSTLPIHAGWRGECIKFVDNKGCTLSEKDRPAMGRALIPSIDGPPCKDSVKGYDKKDAAIEWLEFNDILEEVAKEFGGKPVVDPLELLDNLLTSMFK